jgi:hypothetical protein
MSVNSMFFSGTILLKSSKYYIVKRNFIGKTASLRSFCNRFFRIGLESLTC